MSSSFPAPQESSLLLVSVIMAVYNEEKTVCGVIDDLLGRSFDRFKIELIIVESNSTDSTREKLQLYSDHPSITLITQEKALGKGNAVREGFKHASGEIYLIQDADNEYSLDDYPALLEPLLNHESDFVLGTRHRVGEAMRVLDDEFVNAKILNFGHRIFVIFFNFIYRTQLTDPFTMFKVFRAECIDGLTFHANRFDFDWELVGKLVRRNHLPLEIPISYKARGFDQGKKVSWFIDPLTWIFAAIRFRLESLPPQPSD